MTNQEDLPNVSMSNTKKELLDAYHEAKKQLQAKGKAVLDAEKARKQAEKQAALAAADTQATQDPVHRLQELRGSISRELASLAERFENEIASYRKVETAVKEKQKELDTMYQVETSASDLAALIQAQQARKEEFEFELQRKKEEFEQDMRETRERWNREKSEREREAKEQAEAIKKQRQREKEEYEYSFAREQEQRRNALEDELNSLEKEIEEKRRNFDQELGRKKAEIESREEVLAKQESELAELRKEVESFPERLQSEIHAAREATSEQLTRDFQKEKDLLESRFEGEKNVLSSKIESLQSLVKAQQNQITDLSRRHESAYEKVQDIANRAVAAAKREYVSVPVQSQQGTGQQDK